MVDCKNILYCTDFSEGAKSALPLAIDLAKKYGASLHLVHVYQEPEPLTEYEISSNMKMDWIRMAQTLGGEIEERLKKICLEVSQEIRPCRYTLLRGKPHLEIVRYAKENGIDLIILASHGLSGLEHVLFGSTAERVLRESSCSVLVVKGKK